MDIDIYGIPVAPLPKNESGIHDSLKDLFAKPDNTPTFIQIDPTRYVYSQRQLALSMDVNATKNKDIAVKAFIVQCIYLLFQALLKSDPIHPYTWEEALVNPEVLGKYLEDAAKKDEQNEQSVEQTDKQRTIETENQLTDYLKDLGVPSKKAEDSVDKVVEVVNQQILDNKPVDYYDVNNVLFYSLILGNKVILGSMPKILKRLVVGNSLSLENLQMVFKQCCIALEQYKKDKPTLTLSDVAQIGYPELFHAPEVIYMIMLMKEAALNLGTGFKAFVGIDYVDPIADNWMSPEVAQTTFSEIIGIPSRGSTDTVDSLIEKQVILDVIFGEDIWNLPYLENKFPYLAPEENTDATIVDLKKKFYVHQRRYSEIRDKIMQGGK